MSMNNQTLTTYVKKIKLHCTKAHGSFSIELHQYWRVNLGTYSATMAHLS